jgi:hypothetical protein
MPLRDGPSPGLVMNHSILALRCDQPCDGYAQRAGAMTASRLVEAHDDTATARDLGKDTRLTCVVKDDEDDQKDDQSQGLEPGLYQPTTGENDEPQPIVCGGKL